jgi:NDP-sugar pyrophosphorylase family protein
MWRDVVAAVLAGGLGTRLRPVVADRPKSLAPVRGRPYLSYVLDQLAAAGVGRTVLLTGHGAAAVRSALGDSHRGMRLDYSQEPAPLGTGGAVRHALPLLDAGRVLLLNGDSYCDADLGALLADDHPAEMLLARAQDAGRYGAVTLDDAGRVVRFAEKEPGAGPGWINAGVYSISRHQLDSLPAVSSFSLERDVFPVWARRGELYGHRCDGRFIDIGTPESFAAAAAFFAD